MATTYYARPSENKTPTATLSLTAGAANGGYPLSNLADLNPAKPFKATGTSCTIRATFGSAQTLQGVALINHNLAGATVTVTNGAGFSNALAIPTTPEDGLPLDPWKSYLGLANTSSTTWDLAISGAAANVAIGELLLVATLRELPIRWGLEQSEAHQTITRRTARGVRLKYAFSQRERTVRGRVSVESARADLLALQRDALGAYKGFLLVLDSDVNDALMVDLTTDVRTVLRKQPRLSEVELEFTELQKGPAL